MFDRKKLSENERKNELDGFTEGFATSSHVPSSIDLEEYKKRISVMETSPYYINNEIKKRGRNGFKSNFESVDKKHHKLSLVDCRPNSS